MLRSKGLIEFSSKYQIGKIAEIGNVEIIFVATKMSLDKNDLIFQKLFYNQIGIISQLLMFIERKQ